MKRKFYRAIFQVELLSEVPIGDLSIDMIDYHMTEGAMSGTLSKISESSCSGKRMARHLFRQRSSPSFFNIDEQGNDI